MTGTATFCPKEKLESSLKVFSELPNEAPLWIYGFSRKLLSSECDQIRFVMDAFVKDWKSHGTAVRGAWHFFENRVVLISGIIEGGVSGCSIDSSVKVFKDLRAGGLDALDRNLIFYRNPEGEISSLTRSDFGKKSDLEKTIVIDPTLTSLRELRAGLLEKPFASSWHSKVF